MKDREPRARAAYAELILALVDARADPATVRFDHELSSAIAAGRIEPEFARTLRWWQRESVRGVRDHLADVLPPLLESLETAAAQATNNVQSAETMWRDALAQAVPAAETATSASAERATEPSQADASRPRVLNLPIDLTDHRRRMVVAGLVSANGATAPRSASREGRR